MEVYKVVYLRLTHPPRVYKSGNKGKEEILIMKKEMILVTVSYV